MRIIPKSISKNAFVMHSAATVWVPSRRTTLNLAIDMFHCFSYSANFIPQHAMNEILWVKQGKNSWAGSPYSIFIKATWPSPLLYCPFNSYHFVVRCFYTVIGTSGRLTHLCTWSRHGVHSITSTLRYKHQLKMLVQIR